MDAGGVADRGVGEDRAEADRLGAEIVAREAGAAVRGVALVEQEIEDGEDRVEPRREFVRCGEGEREIALADGALRPDEALGDRRRGDEEGAGDLRHAETGEGLEGEGDLRLARQGGVAAAEDQAQLIVAQTIIALVGIERRLRAGEGLGQLTGQEIHLARQRPLATEGVERGVARDAKEPAGRIDRQAVIRPLAERL